MDGAQQRGMWASRIERCLSADTTIKEWCRLSKVSESNLYRRMARFREEEPGRFPRRSSKASNWIKITAGGIADGRGMAAAFALGAEGVQCGTRFLTVEECTIADAYKERVIAAKDADTIVTGRGSGHPVRCLKNKFARTVRKLEGDVAANGDELEAMYVGSLKRAVEGDVDNGTMMAGQSAALVRERATAAEAIASLVAEAEELGGLGLEALAARNAARGEAR